MSIEQTIVDIICREFGEEYRNEISDETTMADIEGWDSVSYFNVVFALEDSFEVTFTDEELTQLFQIGHIKKIVEAAQLNLPHEDEANAICQLSAVSKNNGSYTDIVILSASSTREGLLRHREAEALLQQKTDNKHRWFNMSVSGLVMPETLQIVEQIDSSFNGILAIGTSPIIWAGCGVSEYERSVNFNRFPFPAPRMLQLMEQFGYKPDSSDPSKHISIATWMERYLKVAISTN